MDLKNTDRENMLRLSLTQIWDQEQEPGVGPGRWS